MDLQLQNQTAVVTGGANGIGRGIADAFAREGANVAILDLAANTQDAAAEIAAANSITAIGVQIDITDYEALQLIATDIAKDMGVHHVVCAAGIGSGKYGFPFWNLSPFDWGKVLDVNVMGVVNSAHAFAPYLVKQQSGAMIFISSVAAQIGSQTDPPYSAAKAAVINFAQCAAKDLAEHNIRVNVISPGMVQTDVNRSVWQAWNDAQPEDAKRSYEDWAGDKVKRIAPLKRWQQPQDIGDAAVFLASDAAKNITGQTLNVDGGQVMHS